MVTSPTTKKNKAWIFFCAKFILVHPSAHACNPAPVAPSVYLPCDPLQIVARPRPRRRRKTRSARSPRVHAAQDIGEKGNRASNLLHSKSHQPPPSPGLRPSRARRQGRRAHLRLKATACGRGFGRAVAGRALIRPPVSRWVAALRACACPWACLHGWSGV